MGGKLRSFLFWSTIINFFILMISGLAIMFAPDLTYELQTAWFNISKETVNITMYAFVGLYKVFWIFFNVIPYVVIRIVGIQ